MKPVCFPPKGLGYIIMRLKIICTIIIALVLIFYLFIIYLFINSNDLFLMVLETGKSTIKVLVNLVSQESSPPGL